MADAAEKPQMAVTPTGKVLSVVSRLAVTAANEVVVETLKEWLAMAERGEITSIAIIGIDRDSDAITEWSTPVKWDPLISGIAKAQYRVLKAADACAELVNNETSDDDSDGEDDE
jgi:hypothetical protein